MGGAGVPTEGDEITRIALHFTYRADVPPRSPSYSLRRWYSLIYVRFLALNSRVEILRNDSEKRGGEGKAVRWRWRVRSPSVTVPMASLPAPELESRWLAGPTPVNGPSPIGRRVQN